MSLRAATASLRIQLSNTLARPIFQVLIIVEPMMMAVLAYFVRDPSDTSARFSVVLGSGLSGMWVATAFSSAGDLERERFQGTIPAMLLSATPLWLLSAGRAAGALVLSVIPVAVSLLFSALALRVEPPPGASAGGLLVSVATFGLGCHCFGLLLSHLFLLSRRTTVLQNFLEWPLLIASGVIFPITALPQGVQWLAAALPMRWAAEAAARSFTAGGLPARPLAVAVALAGAYLALAIALSGAIERRVRVTASLEVA